MTKPKREAEPEPTQAEPTQPRPRDGDGHELDSYGLPISGPVRAARLAELGKPDPLEDPASWGNGAASPNSAE